MERVIGSSLSRRNRLIVAVFVILAKIAMIWLLVRGWPIARPSAKAPTLTTLSLPPPAPAPVPHARPIHHPAAKPHKAPAPPALKARATPIVAPRPVVSIRVAPLLQTTIVASVGEESHQGAGVSPGIGQGAGGSGIGQGAGGSGSGGGGGEDDQTPPRWLRGRLKDSDFPKAAAARGSSGTVTVQFAVEINGRVDDCRILHSSGDLDLDETTCRLIEKRFRYEPSRDADGGPVRSQVVERHGWSVQAIPADDRGPTER